MINKFNININDVNRRGFVVIMSVIVVTLIVTVGIGILAITFRELVISNVSRESVRALYSADSGVECAFHYDSLPRANPPTPNFATPILPTIFQPGPSASITCLGQVFNLDFNDSSIVEKLNCTAAFPPQAGCTYITKLGELGSTTNRPLEVDGVIDGLGPCVTVEVRKIAVSGTRDKTEIEARGINECAGARRVERALLLEWE